MIKKFKNSINFLVDNHNFNDLFFSKNINILFRLLLISSLIYFSIIFYLNYFFDFKIVEILKDNPFFQKKENVFHGLISNFGILLWFLNFTVILLTIKKLKRKKFKNFKNKLHKFLYFSCFFNLLLFVCDIYDFHNGMAKIFYPLFLVYSVVIIYYLLQISFLKEKILIFISSFLFLFFSILVDLYQKENIFNIPYAYSTAIEELFKFIGIIYFTFFWLSTFKAISKIIK